MVTGVCHDADALHRAVARIAELRHRFNLREGWTIAEDRLPDRFYDQPLADGAALERGALAAQVAAYHALRGRGIEGRSMPTREPGLTDL